MATDIHVSGLRELNEFLDTLPAKIAANIMRGAFREGIRQIQPHAMTSIHPVSGLLAAYLKIGTRVRRDGTVMAYLKTTGPHAYLAGWVEFGTRPHFISVAEEEKNVNVRRSIKLGRLVRESMTTINRRVLRIGQTFVGPTVHHPGAKPHPFMRPALDAHAQEAVMAAAAYMKRRLATKHGLDTADVKIEGDE